MFQFLERVMHQWYHDVESSLYRETSLGTRQLKRDYDECSYDSSS